MEHLPISDQAVLNRWRLVLGKNASGHMGLDGRLKGMDEALDFLYSREQKADERQDQGGMEASHLTVAAWLNEVRRLFPKETVQVLERHALERYQLKELLTDREVLEKLEPNQALLGTILSLKHLMSDQVLAAAREIVRKVAAQLTERMKMDLERSLLGKIQRNTSSPVRSIRNLDVKKTIRKNLAHYDREEKRLLLEQVYFNGRVKRYNSWRVVIAVDESGSMTDSIIHSAVMAGIFARLPMVEVRLVIFDTQVVDLSGYADDPVEVLMSVQLGGGTNIAGALEYCKGLISSPHKTLLVLVSDLCEGGPAANLYGVCSDLLESGVKVAALTALDQDANPAYNRTVARVLADMGAFVGAMTPEQLGDYLGKMMS